MTLLGWLQQHWAQVSPTILLALLAHPTVRRFIRVSTMAALEPMRLVAENLELAKENSMETQRGSFYESAYSGMKAQLDVVNERVVHLQQDCIVLLREVDSFRAKLEEVTKISRLRAESNLRLSADLEAAKYWARSNAAALVKAGILPTAEPTWEAAGYNILHPEDVAP